jgi:endonuclease YncB( thermonuclease family)
MLQPRAWFTPLSRILWLVVVVVVLSLIIQPTPAAGQEADVKRVPPGGAPPAGSGPVDVPGFVRVIDGDTIEFYLDGSRAGNGSLVGVGLIGVEAPQGNTATESYPKIAS